MEDKVFWNYSAPGISLCAVSGRITIFKTTLAAIGCPEFYRFLYDPGKASLLFRLAGKMMKVLISCAYERTVTAMKSSV